MLSHHRATPRPGGAFLLPRLSFSVAVCAVVCSPFLCQALSLSWPSPKPGRSGDSHSGRDRAATFSSPAPARRRLFSFQAHLGFPHCPFPQTPRHHSSHAPSTFFFFFFSSAGMEASWRQVAGGRGRARGRATAAPSSGNGVHLRGAGGGREKGSVGAAGPGLSLGGAATPAAAGTSARCSPAGSEAPQTSVAGGENGFCSRAHLNAHRLRRCLVRAASAFISFLLLREFIIGLTSQGFQAAAHSRPIPITPYSSSV